jgi:hypothetical protein
MRRNTGPQVEAPGQDSFLDVTTNLVGILIILVMVIGTRAKQAMVEQDPGQPAGTSPAQVDVAAARAAAQAVEQDIHEIDAKIKRHQFESAYRGAERDRFLKLVTVAKRDLEERRQQLDGVQRAHLELQRDLREARRGFEDLKASRQSLENGKPAPGVIEHLPTPLAKTVFGKEVHFRLSAGRLAYVPWDELVTQLKAEAPQKVWKLRDASQLTEVIGPVRGFRMTYTLRQTAQVAQLGSAVSSQRQIGLQRFVLVPVIEDLGEPVARALQPNSEFRSVLSGYDPNRTTVTVWVYPDSFQQFRTLKAELFRLGYLAAGRPMPPGLPISGSPQGTRSAAE